MFTLPVLMYASTGVQCRLLLYAGNALSCYRLMRTHGSPLRVIATEYDTGDSVGDGFALRSAHPPHICTSNASALICPPVGNLRLRFIPGIFGRMFLLWSAYLFCTDVACPTLLRSGPEVSSLGHADSASVHHTLSLSDSSRPLKSASGSSAIFVGCTPRGIV